MTAMSWLRAALRGAVLLVLVFGGLTVLLILRLVERPLYGLRRPVTPYITMAVCRAALRVLGIARHVEGRQMRGRGAIVANHSSWLDIFALNATAPVYFVSKSEVAQWPGIGWLAKATGTLFVERDPSQARAQTLLLQRRLLAGHTLLFFPEGTSTDAMQVLPFKTTLFQSFLAPNLNELTAIQPVSLSYIAPPGTDRRFYGWWGDMSFAGHLLTTLAAARQGAIHLRYHAPLPVADFADRKTLARACEASVREGHQALAQSS